MHTALYFPTTPEWWNWQTRGIQNPVGLISRAGSSPASGNILVVWSSLPVVTAAAVSPGGCKRFVVHQSVRNFGGTFCDHLPGSLTKIMDVCAGCFAAFDIGELSRFTSCCDVASIYCVTSNRWCNMLNMNPIRFHWGRVADCIEIRHYFCPGLRRHLIQLPLA